MSNLQNTNRLPLRAIMTNKSKSHTVTNDQLERKTRALEGSLNKLKLNIQQNPTKSIIDAQRRNRSKEMTQVARDKPAGNLLPTKPKPMIKCGQCEKIEAKMKCLECVENYCSTCFDQFHLRGALQRHHCISLSTSPKKNLNDNLQRKLNLNEPENVTNNNDKTNLSSFQQSFLQWRDNNINKSQQKRRLGSPSNDKIEYSNKLPHIESNSTRKDPYTSFIQRSKNTKKDQQKLGVLINIRDSISEIDPLNDDIPTTVTAGSIELINPEEILNNDHNLEEKQPIIDVLIKSHSRPTSSLIKKDSINSRPNSTAFAQESLRSLLTSKSTDELEAIVDAQLILSRPSTCKSEKLDEADWQPLQSISNNMDIPPIETNENKTTVQFDLPLDELKTESVYPLTNSSENIPQVKTAKNDSSTHVFRMNSTTPTPRRNSPFSFTNSLYKTSRINSSSSTDTPDDGGFFTDVLPRKIIPTPISLPPLPVPPPVLDCSPSNEWKHTLDNPSTNEPDQTIPLRKSSITSLSRTSAKHPITCVQRSKSQIDNNSRSASSLSSSSLPVSMRSSKLGFDISESQSSTTSSSRKSSPTSSSSTSTLKDTSTSTQKTSSSLRSKGTSSATAETSSSALISNSASSTTTTAETSSTDTTNKTSSSASTPKPTIKTPSPQPEPIIPSVTDKINEILPSDSDECLQESMESLTNKTSSETNGELAKTNIIPSITREENITENDLSATKKAHRRQTITSDESSKYRKLEFSVGVGVQWQEASAESLSSTEILPSDQSSKVETPHSLTPSNPINTKLAEQFSKYDNDDGRSSRTYQNINDDEYFNQLRQELCSELDTRGSDEDAILNDQILRILQGVQKPFNEKDLLIIDTKLRETESVHQSSIDT